MRSRFITELGRGPGTLASASFCRYGRVDIRFLDQDEGVEILLRLPVGVAIFLDRALHSDPRILGKDQEES